MSTSVVFAGSPALAVPYLDALVADGFDVRAVITRKPAPVGRKRIVTPTPVEQAAHKHGLSVIQANSLKDVDVPVVELGVVVAYGALIPPSLLAVPSHGWINVHFSELPLYRGAAPVQRALWDGRSQTGISIFRLVDELDAGPVFQSRTIPFHDDETASAALDRLSRETTVDLVETIRHIVSGNAVAREQSGKPSFAPKFSKDDARIVWTERAETIGHRIRALSDEPGAHGIVGDERIGIVRATVADDRDLHPGQVVAGNDGVFVGTADGSIHLLEVKPAGKSVMSAQDWARGLRDSVTFQ